MQECLQNAHYKKVNQQFVKDAWGPITVAARCEQEVHVWTRSIRLTSHFTVTNCSSTAERRESCRGFLVDWSLENILWVTHFGSEAPTHTEIRFRCRETDMNWARHQRCQGCGFDSPQDASTIKKSSAGFLGMKARSSCWAHMTEPEQECRVLFHPASHAHSERVPVSVSR